MSAGWEVLVGVVIVIGLIGVILPILPGVLLVFGAILVWALVESSTTGWIVLTICTALLLISGVIKYTWPGARMRTAGVPTRSLVLGGLLGIVGFFVIPVIGLVIGFLLGTYLSEAQRMRTHRDAWQSTWHATKAVGLSILVELFGALLASGVWLIAALTS